MATFHESASIEGVVEVIPQVFADDRGYFVETYRREWFGLGREMVQGNRGNRDAGSVVGLHFHLHQADYWYVPSGHARVVLHDLRIGSPTEGATQMLDMGEIDGINEHLGLFIPPGVAHGFSSLTDCVITYLVDGYYNTADELGVAWDDPEIAADWGVQNPILSPRDAANPRRCDIIERHRPPYPLRT